MRLFKNLILAELKAVLFLIFLPFGVVLGVFMLMWHVLDMPPRSVDREEYVNMVKWDAGFILRCVEKPFLTALRGICEFIADAFIISRQTSSTRRR